MLKTIIVVILTAFTLGLLGETAVTLVEGAKGVLPTLHTAIELVICWLVVLVTFFVAVIKSLNNRWW